MYWTMRDGRQIEISKMTDSHLLNTLAMLNAQESKVLNMVIGGYQPQGEMAQDFYNMEIDNLGEMPYGLNNPSYGPLFAEAKRRGLK